jgi:2-succinyl-5-enolpyruvyl-6-hydroxy-3-cyclohexene-1-carboxylate synthase
VHEAVPATAFAATFLTELSRQGVQHVVVSPGSRSQALALAAAELETLGRIRLHVRIDERVGGFLALGLAVESGSPVAVITTSGTAVANLHPAALEAHHQGVPLVLLTGDRPEELRGVGANQTTTQPGIFAGAVESWDIPAPEGEPGEIDEARALAARAVSTARGGDGGSPRPVHVNLALREPLSSPDAAAVIDAVLAMPELGPRPHSVVHLTVTAELEPQPHTVVIAGAGAGERAERLARDLGAPLLAEVGSGARFGPNLVVAYRALLREPDAFPVRRAIVVGRPTLSREVSALVARDDVEIIGVRGPGAEDYDPGRRMTRIVDEAVVPEPADARDPAVRERVGRWVAASRQLVGDGDDIAPAIDASDGDFARGELTAVRATVTRRTLVEAVWRATWPHDRLVLGASRLIRELDGAVPGKRVPVHANRGLAGIDGTIATAIGVAQASQSPLEDVPAAETTTGAGAAERASDRPLPERGTLGTTRVLLGDLAMLHDVGALALAPGEPRPRIQVIVGDDGGGTIFDLLEVGRNPGPGFARVMRTPQPVDLAALAAAFGWAHVRVETRGALDQALTASSGPTLIEVPLPR